MARDDGAGSPPPVPWWVRIVDAISLLLLAVLAWKILTADARAGIFDYIPRVRTLFLLYALVGLAAVRHLALPRPTAGARLRHGWRRIADAPDWGPAVRAFLGTRLMVFVVGFFAVITFGLHEPGFVAAADPLTNLIARFDAGWYGEIALDGYDRDASFDKQRNIAFFPAMPVLMRVTGPLFGTGRFGLPREMRMARTLWAGACVSLLAFLFALWYLMRIGTDLIGRERAEGAVLLLATYPFACFFNAPYTESLFLLGAVAATFHFLRGQWMRAASWGLLVGLTRPNGFLLCVPLAVLALQHSRWRGKSTSPAQTIKALGAAVMPVVGMLAFTAYLQALTGVWFAWSKNHAAWGRSYTGFDPLLHGLGRLSDDGLVKVAASYPFDVLNTLAAAFAVLMIWPVARRIGVAWAVYVAIMIFPPMLAGGALSLGRLTSTLFPLFLALAGILPSRAVPSWAAAFAILQGLCAALFFTWRELF